MKIEIEVKKTKRKWVEILAKVGLKNRTLSTEKILSSTEIRHYAGNAENLIMDKLKGALEDVAGHPVYLLLEEITAPEDK